MRIPIITDLISRDGTTSKDAGMQNCFVDGENAVKRPAASTNLVDVTGTAQGGIDHNSLVYIINGDTLRSYDTSYTLTETITL